MSNLIPVILCGGSGTRLQPLSTPDKPKQFLSLIDNYSLLQNTLQRLDGLPNLGTPIIISNIKYKNLVQEQLSAIKIKAKIILEPVGRNTAPAIAAAAIYAKKMANKPLLLILPADHAIADVESFYNAVKIAVKKAQQNYLITFGIKPAKPATDYGYIKIAEDFTIKKFVEKPDLELAKKYIADGGYYWNSGMFIFAANNILQEFKYYAQDIYIKINEVMQDSECNNNCLYLSSEFVKCPGNSIDYAIMEKTAQGFMIPLDAGWSDVGTWEALEEYKLMRKNID